MTKRNPLSQIFFLVLMSTTFLACGKADQFLYTVKNQKQKNLFCDCPADFTPTSDFSKCSRESKISPLKPTNPTLILPGDDGPYYRAALYLANTDGDPNWPFVTVSEYYNGRDPFMLDAKNSTFPFTTISTIDPVFQFWHRRVTGPERVSIKGKLAEVWYTKTFCIDLPSPKNYLIHVGADNKYRIKIDGKTFAICDMDGCFGTGVLYNQSLPTGKHLVELKFINKDQDSWGAAWFEIFDNSFRDAKQARFGANMKVVYSSKSLVGDFWDYSDEICPEGYAYDVCSKDKTCTKLEYADCRK